MRLCGFVSPRRFFVLRDKLSRGAGRLPGMPLSAEPRFGHSSTQHRNGGLFMTTINLKDFYYWYTQDQFIEVSDEIAEVFVADARHEMAYQRRLSRHKAQYSLDCDDGIEYSACLHEPTPQELLERIVWRPLFSLRYNSKSIWLFHTRK